MIHDVTNYWDLVVPTYIENWPEGLSNLSVSHVSLPLGMPRAFLLIFGCIMDGKEIAPLHQSYLVAMEAKLDNAIQAFPHGCFIRLGSRSPKDSWLGIDKGFKCTTGHHALSLLLDSPDRIYDDVALAVAHDYQPQIYLRKWVDIPEWSEFRCFMHKGKLVGISQYSYLNRERFPEVCDNSGSISWAIEKFFEGYLRPILYPHFESVVFDVFVKVRGHGNAREWQVKLLEINPWFQGTDPCLFSWEHPEDFNGSFRFCIEPTPAKPDPDEYLEDLKAELRTDREATP